MHVRSIVLTGLVLAVLMLSMVVVPPSQATGPLSAVKACLGPGHGGAEVVMTRTNDSCLDDSNRYTFCNEEKAAILVPAPMR